MGEETISTTNELGSQGLLTLRTDSSISIKYAQNFDTHDDIMLLEADESLLTEILQHGVTIRGNLEEEAVLCTSSKTYAMKHVSTSNSVFLIPPADSQFSDASDITESLLSGDELETEPKVPTIGALMLASRHMELVQVPPRLEKLKAILGQRPYREDGDEDMGGVEGGLYTFGNLLDIIQASEIELIEGLRSISAMEMDGYWRLVDDKYMGCLLDVMLLNCMAHDWSRNSLEASEVVPVMEKDGFPRRVVEHCLEVYGSKVAEGDEIWCLDERLVSLRYAKQLMNAGKWKLDDFMEAWMQNLPSGLSATKEMLKGEALLEQFGADVWVRPFSVSSLPTVPADRFAALFKERPRWEWQDLEPYIRELKVPGLSVEALLIKYTRRSQPTPDSPVIFSAR